MKATITNKQPVFTITDADTLQGAGESGPMQFAVTIAEPTGGTIESNPEAGTINENTIMVLKATPASGYRWAQWIINTVSNTTQFTYKKITQITNIAAQFIKQWTLTVTQPDNGTITVDQTSGLLDEGTTVNANLAVSEGYEGTLTVNDVDTGKTSISQIVSSNISLGAIVSAILTEIINLFTTAPTKIGDSYFIQDISGQNNNSEVGNVRIGKMNQSALSTTVYLVGKQQIDFEVDYFINLTTKNYNTIMGAGSVTSTQKGMWMRIQSINMYLDIGNGTNIISYIIAPGVLLEFGTDDNTRYNIKFSWNGIAGTNATTIVNGITYTTLISTDWEGNSHYPIEICSYNAMRSGLSDGWFTRFKLDNYFEYILNHGQGNIIYDISENGNNGTIVGATTATFWDSTANGVQPYELTLGATLYKNNTNNSIMPICGNNYYTITGFTRLGYFPPATGALKGLPNTYNISGVDAIIPEGAYTADEIAAVTSENLEVTQTEFAVTQLIINI